MSKPSTYQERLAWLRAVGGVSGRELHRLAGVSLSYAYSVESLPNPSPRSQSAQLLSRCFGVPRSWLMFGEGRLPSEEAVRRAVKRARARVGQVATGGS